MRGCADHEAFLPSCPACHSAAVQAQIGALRRKSRQFAIESRVGRAGIPRRFAERRFGEYVTGTPEQRFALEAVQAYGEQFAAIRKSGACLMLVGKPGTGKTHLAAALLTAVISRGWSGLFIPMSEALRKIRATYSPRADWTEEQVFEALVKPDLLVLDEVGVAIGDADKRRAILFDIINARYNELRPTCLLANMTRRELEAYLGERAMDRLLENGGSLIPFTWNSYRTAHPAA
jgi:DNA replication protein DnaC